MAHLNPQFAEIYALANQCTQLDRANAKLLGEISNKANRNTEILNCQKCVNILKNSPIQIDTNKANSGFQSLVNRPKPVSIIQRSSKQVQQDQLQYAEIQILANTYINLSDFKKFQQETQITVENDTLILPANKTFLCFIIGYLHLCVVTNNWHRINRLKKMILDCNFDLYLPECKQMNELIQSGNNVKALGLKIINEIKKLNSIDKLFLFYDVSQTLEFIFACLIMQDKGKTHFEKLPKDQLPGNFQKLLKIETVVLKVSGSLQFFDEIGHKLSISKEGQRIFINCHKI